MLRLRGSAAVYGEVWYDEQPPANHAVDIVVYRQRSAPVANAQHVRFLSLVTDLAHGEDAIASQLRRKCRYEIRRADTKDGLSAGYVEDPAPLLGQFQAFYDDFAVQKALPLCDMIWLRAACASGRLVLTSAGHGGAPLVWHAYLKCGPVVRLVHSASHFRNRAPAFRALVGRANRWLHWHDMLRLRQAGFERYDWGGLFADESMPAHAGVNEFKRSFGGTQSLSYDCTLPANLKGRLYLRLRDAWRRSGRAPAQRAAR